MHNEYLQSLVDLGVVGGLLLAAVLVAIGFTVRRGPVPARPLPLRYGALAGLAALAVVFAPVRLTCEPGATAYLSVSATENAGGFIASGTRSQGVPCTGAVQKVTLAVVPTQRAFVPGVAFGQADVMVCVLTCTSAADERNVTIVTK